jgi:hypothetical protein
MAERRSRSKAAGRAPAKKRAPTRGTAPSSANIEKLEKFEASDEAKAHQPSDVDAMGRDKRRQVVGHAYGPSRKSQLIFFAAVGAFMLVVVGGFFAAVQAFDQPEDEYADEAPWSAADAQQIPTRDPSGPCGEPGNPYPFPAGSACATDKTSENQPPVASTEGDEATAEGRAPGQEEGSGGATNSGGEASSSGGSASN